MGYLFSSELCPKVILTKVANFQISDAIYHFAFDPKSHVACETFVTTGQGHRWRSYF